MIDLNMIQKDEDNEKSIENFIILICIFDLFGDGEV